ncbi:MATE family efflux transporter [Oceanomicrobium pacificus]|uniref:Multidrug-efflux transporter n=1 Tax=Oceanomicrobium pacificus TaxID=2692916 RepID=A0A6B0TP83_9RHOB|nr:MATE family efflux transporter [Oceanomicrobium pacificus]MXU64419.1 MATE family efflux transporter [Oceanomicrobium pacificus]
MASTAEAPRTAPHVIESPLGWRRELAATLRLAWPLIVAQLAQIGLGTTDVVMMGWLGPEFLGAGTLANSLLHVVLIMGIGTVLAVSPLLSQAIGGRDYRSVRRTTRQGLWVAIAFTAVFTPVLMQLEMILRLFGQSEDVAALAATYSTAALWLLLPALSFIILRSLLAAHGESRIVLVVTLVGLVINALGNYGLMFGNFGLPRLELRGAGITTVFVNLAMFLCLLAYILTHRRYRRYHILVRFWKPDWPRFLTVLKLGMPIGMMLLAETAMFAAAALLMGWLGEDHLAAHAVALQLAAIAFMVPLGLSQATTVRVGLAYGRRHEADVRMAGWVSILACLGFMSCTALLFWTRAPQLVGLFLDPADPAAATSIALATGFLGVAALFQLVDGAQVAGAAALRGMNDTKIPMFVAFFGYWGVGLPAAYLLAFKAGLGGTGIWFGLAAGLSAAAVILLSRFAILSRRLEFGPVAPKSAELP